MELFTVLVAAVAVLAAALYYYLTKDRGVIEKMGIPIDPPYLVFGSEPRALHKITHTFYIEKFNKYGKTYGRYDGRFPTIVTKDPELIKSVLVKNFDSFHASIDLKLTDKVSTVDATNGDLWKALRKNMSPTFSSSKLKGMMAPISDVIDKFLGHMDKAADKGSAVPIKTMFEGLASDVIAKCAFGIESDAIANPDQEIIRLGRAFFEFIQPKSWLETLGFLIPIKYFRFVIDVVSPFPDAFYKLWNITDSIMKQREQQGTQGTDFVGRLMELKKDVARNPTAENNKKLNDTIITAQGTIFFAAGFETTANTMSTLSFELANRPELQDRLHEEIRDVLGDGFEGKITQEAIEKMEYLEATVQENLRINSPILLTIRQCMKDCEIAPGMLIRKGMQIETPIYAAHHDPEFFPDPEEFRPERFLKENASNIIPFTYRPFGGGPRQCIAQRFALNEVKMTMAKLLLSYRLIPTKNTKLNYSPGSFVVLNYTGLEVKVEKRKQD